MYTPRTELLFNKERFSEYAAGIKVKIQSDIVSDEPLYGVEGQSLRQKLLNKYKVPVPHITEKKAVVSKDNIEYKIRFEGANGGFFHYWPSEKVQNDRPEGEAISNCVSLYFHNTNDAEAIKLEINEKFDDFEAWYEALKKEVVEFNNGLAAYIDEVIKENEARLAREKKLEAELNS